MFWVWLPTAVRVVVGEGRILWGDTGLMFQPASWRWAAEGFHSAVVSLYQHCCNVLRAIGYLHVWCLHSQGCLLLEMYVYAHRAPYVMFTFTGLPPNKLILEKHLSDSLWSSFQIWRHLYIGKLPPKFWDGGDYSTWPAGFLGLLYPSKVPIANFFEIWGFIANATMMVIVIWLFFGLLA